MSSAATFPDWPATGILDAHINDATNFDLNDTWLGLVISTLSGLSLLLLNDIVFRTAVRAHRDDTSSQPVLRHSLVSQVCNPFLSLDDLGSSPSKVKAARLWSEHDELRDAPAKLQPSSAPLPQLMLSELDPVDYPHVSNTTLHQPYQTEKQARTKWGRRVAIALSAILLVSADLLLIFLSTNRTSPLSFAPDDVRVPVFALNPAVPTGPPARPPFPGGRCAQRPMTARPGFISKASAFRCSTLRERRNPRHDNGTTFPTATVSLSVQRNAAVCGASLPHYKAPVVSMFTELSTYVTLPDGFQYDAPLALEPGTTAKALRMALASAGVRMLSDPALVRDEPSEKAVAPPGTADRSADWSVRAVVDFKSVPLPEAFRDSKPFNGFANVTDAHRRVQVLTQIACGRLGVYAAARGVQMTRSESWHPRYLDEVEKPLVVSQRPWLSAAAAAGLMGALAVLWACIALGLRWQASPDYDAFMRLFAPVREWGALGGGVMAWGNEEECEALGYWDSGRTSVGGQTGL